MGPLLAPNGHVYAVVACPLLGEERKSLPTVKMTAFDPERPIGGRLCHILSPGGGLQAR